MITISFVRHDGDIYHEKYFFARTFCDYMLMLELYDAKTGIQSLIRSKREFLRSGVSSLFYALYLKGLMIFILPKKT